MSRLLPGNPFCVSGDINKNTIGTRPAAPGVVTADNYATHFSKSIADELRHDDAAMASELAVLAPHNSRRHRSHGASATVGDETALATRFTSSSTPSKSKKVVHRLELHENVSTDVFVGKKREVGLVRMSLATKKAEIRKLDVEMDAIEKRLRQEQEQLENTRAKFNNFLKHSNLEQDAAVRRADTATKAKNDKILEIKKLSARIGQVEIDIRKTDVQLQNCIIYKKFMDDMTKPQWFFDVLRDLRVADSTETIVLDAEEEYQKRCVELEEKYHRDVATSEEVVQKGGLKNSEIAATKGTTRDGASDPGANGLPSIVPLDIQISELHEEMENATKEKVEAANRDIEDRIRAMTVEEVRETLRRDYDESRMPIYFTSVDQILQVFINVEEGNLFLIQNCQELEEELDGVTLDFMTERDCLRTMTEQRHAQMDALAEKIRDAQAKLRTLEQRSAALDKPTVVPTYDASSKGPSSLRTGTSAPTQKNKAAPGTELSREQFKKNVEKAIASIFALLTAGDNAIKAAVAASQRRQALQNAAVAGAIDKDVRGEDAGNTSQQQATGRKKKPEQVLSAPLSSSGKSVSSPSGKTKVLKRPSPPTRSQNANASSAPRTNGNEARANIGPIEMLTTIENKLEEYHRYICNPVSGIDAAAILSVMRTSDKQRRKDARQVQLARQAVEREEHSRKALERSQAPIFKKIGKPVMLRSCLVHDGGAGRQISSSGNANDSDNDGSEFF